MNSDLYKHRYFLTQNENVFKSLDTSLTWCKVAHISRMSEWKINSGFLKFASIINSERPYGKH